jgi:hypothetical protein
MSFFTHPIICAVSSPIKAFLQIDSVRSLFGQPLAVYLRSDSVNFI